MIAPLRSSPSDRAGSCLKKEFFYFNLKKEGRAWAGCRGEEGGPGRGDRMWVPAWSQPVWRTPAPPLQGNTRSPRPGHINHPDGQWRDCRGQPQVGRSHSCGTFLVGFLASLGSGKELEGGQPLCRRLRASGVEKSEHGLGGSGQISALFPSCAWWAQDLSHSQSPERCFPPPAQQSGSEPAAATPAPGSPGICAE